MFDGLDDIDWEQYGECHIAMGMKTKAIPQSIRNMLHDDPEEREYAIQDILGEGQHLGNLDHATPAIIPFVLEVLEDTKYRERGYLMLGLSLMCDSLFYSERVSYMRLALKTFEAIKQGFPLYKRLIDDSEQETRLYTVIVLGWMQDDASEVVDVLLERLKIETDEEVRIEIIKRTIHLIYNGLSIYAGKGMESIRALYDFVKDCDSFDEKLIYVQELANLHFGHDKDINAFMEKTLLHAKKDNE